VPCSRALEATMEIRRIGSQSKPDDPL
jgi:hypothetical protein